MFDCCQAGGFRASSADPVCHSDKASPLPYLCGEACGLARSAQPGPRLSPPSQLPTSESQAEQSGGPLETLERVTVRGRGIYMARSQPIVYTLSHSVTSSHTPPPPFLTSSSFILQLTDSVLHIFFPLFCSLLSPDTFLCHPRFLHSGSPDSNPQQIFHHHFNKARNSHVVNMINSSD